MAENYEKSNPKLHKLLIKYIDLFRNGVECLTQKESDTIYKATINTKIHQSETMRPKVEKELEKLERDGIISKIKMSDWASPIVPVLKKNGPLRICGDVKVTANRVLQVYQCPLPCIDDIFLRH